MASPAATMARLLAAGPDNERINVQKYLVLAPEREKGCARKYGFYWMSSSIPVNG